MISPYHREIDFEHIFHLTTKTFSYHFATDLWWLSLYKVWISSYGFHATFHERVTLKRFYTLEEKLNMLSPALLHYNQWLLCPAELGIQFNLLNFTAVYVSCETTKRISVKQSMIVPTKYLYPYYAPEMMIIVFVVRVNNDNCAT